MEGKSYGGGKREDVRKLGTEGEVWDNREKGSGIK